MTTHPSYTFVKDFHSPDFNVGGKVYKHIKTGAEVVSMEAKDVNKVFLITFKTLPTNSHGIPHVLEHSVLCGSRDYPVKEPFSAMLKGSLNTFLNAFTYPDRTCYPVASSNQKDFHNLVNVYLDAVLFPRVIYDKEGENILKQEGWHYELAHVDEQAKNKPLEEKTYDDFGKLTIQGVVYNEMKGVYSSPDSLLYRRVNQQILQDHPIYKIDSGGDPDVIPNLSYEELSQFYKKFYHPSNSKVYFYGDDDLEQRLVILDKYFSQFDKDDAVNDKSDKTISFQPLKDLSSAPIQKVPYAIDASQPALHNFAYGYLLNKDHASSKEKFLLTVLDYLLFGASTSVMQKFLTESNLAERVSGGLSDWSQHLIYSMNVKGVKEENVDKIEDLFARANEHVLQNGFTKDSIEAAIAKIEFDLREFSQNSYPKGLLFFLNMDTLSNYGLDPLESLYFEKDLKEIKEEFANNPNLFLDLYKKVLAENKHVVKFQTVPDSELGAKEDLEQKEKLEKLKKSFSIKELEDIVKDTVLLKEIQAKPDSPEALATIPKLNLEDIPVESYIPPREIDGVNINAAQEFTIKNKDIHDDLYASDVSITKHDLPSQGIVYANVVLDCNFLSFEEIKYLKLFIDLLSEVGTTNLSPTDLTNKIDRHTGGISFSKTSSVIRNPQSDEDINKIKQQLAARNIKIDHLTNEDLLTLFPASTDECKLFFQITGKCLVSELDNMLALIKDMLLNPDLKNKTRIIELIKESKSYKEQAVITAGHRYANTNTFSRLMLNSYIDNIYSGLHSIQSISEILEEAENDWEGLEQKLRNIKDKIIFRAAPSSSSKYIGPVINLTTDTQHLNNSRDAFLEKFYKELPQKDISTLASTDNFVKQWQNNKDKYVSNKDEIYTIPSKVNYVGFGGKLIEENELNTPSLRVVNNNINNDCLWNSVRIQGGAYGAGLTLNSGHCSFYSYRDPHLTKTIENYKNLTTYLDECAQNFTNEDILPSIIGVIGDLDKPLNSQGNGATSFYSYLNRISNNNIQLNRQIILSTKNEDYSLYSQKLKNIFDLSSPKSGYLSSVASSQFVEEDLPALQKFFNRDISIKSAIGKKEN